MLIALAQIAPALGDLEKNVGLHVEAVEKARKEKAGLVVFPELSLCGYNLRDLTPEVALDPEKDKRFRELLSLSRTIDLVLGFVEKNKNGLVYNAAAYLRAGRILHIHRKVYLPTYGMFDEGRFFAAAKEFRTFASPLGPTGLLICREFLHLSAGYLLQVGGAAMVVVISAAPGRGVSFEGKRPRRASPGVNPPLVSQGRGFDTSRMWELMGEALSFFSSSYVLYCNRVGVEDGMTFAGGSFVYDPFGRLLVKASYTQKDLLLSEVMPQEIQRARKVWPWVRDDKPEVILLALQNALGRHED